MTPATFVRALAEIRLDGVFNPYADTCEVFDRADAAASRRRNLRNFLSAVSELNTDTIWMGRDLGYRGGRRTGVALTDEAHLEQMDQIYPGATSQQATRGPQVAERTAKEIWAVLQTVDRPPFLWNVFPFHPFEDGNQFTNRRFTSRELACVNDLNSELIRWLCIRRIVAIGQDAASYAAQFCNQVVTVRHPSYGGTSEFRAGIRALYPSAVRMCSARQHALF
jgi:hypothetical protein